MRAHLLEGLDAGFVEPEPERASFEVCLFAILVLTAASWAVMLVSAFVFWNLFRHPVEIVLVQAVQAVWGLAGAAVDLCRAFALLRGLA